MTTGHTLLYGVIGQPIRHSASPAILTAAFRTLGLDAEYVAFEVDRADLSAALVGAEALGIAGLNVTSPHKEECLRRVHRKSGQALAVGAVNTLTREGRELVGHNTDADGFVASLREAGIDPKGARVVVLGAGGAAQAVLVGLASAGAASFFVASRNMERAKAACDRLSRDKTGATWSSGSLTDAKRESSLADLVVQSTPMGMEGGPEGGLAVAAVDLDRLPAQATVVDLVYRPRVTPLLRAAREAGLRTIDGTGMLVHQAALAVSLWTNRSAPLAEMRAALEHSLEEAGVQP